MSYYWSTDAHPEGKSEQDDRRWLSRPKLKLTPESRSIVLGIEMCHGGELADPLTLRLRRRGQRDDDGWLLEYPAFDTDMQGRARFILDSQIHALAAGRYEAQVRRGCYVCGSMELDIDKTCAVDLDTAVAVEGETVKVVNGEIPNVTDIFQTVNTLSLQLCAILEATDARLPLAQTDKDQMCALVLCRGVELMLTDGVKSEIVLFQGCQDGEVVVTRGQAGTSAARFPVGTDLCFTWTTSNVAAAAEGCL